MATARRASNVIVVSPPRRRAVARRRGRIRRAARRGRAVARRSALPAATLVGAAALGWAQAKGHLNKIPTVGGSRALTLAIAGYAATRLVRNHHVKRLGETAMIVGAFDWGAKQGGGKSSLEGDDDLDAFDIEGDDDDFDDEDI